MSGLEVLALVLALYLLTQAVAIPLGHVIGKRVGGLRVASLYVAGAALIACIWLIVSGQR